MRILACPKCGSINVGTGRVRDTPLSLVEPLEHWRETCKDCGHKGMFIEFDSENDYKVFLKELKKQEKE